MWERNKDNFGHRAEVREIRAQLGRAVIEHQEGRTGARIVCHPFASSEMNVLCIQSAKIGVTTSKVPL
jgi:hypothetical protein